MGVISHPIGKVSELEPDSFFIPSCDREEMAAILAIEYEAGRGSADGVWEEREGVGSTHSHTHCASR